MFGLVCMCCLALHMHATVSAESSYEPWMYFIVERVLCSLISISYRNISVLLDLSKLSVTLFTLGEGGICLYYSVYAWKSNVFSISLPSPLYQVNTLSLNNVITYPHWFLTAYKNLWHLPALAGTSVSNTQTYTTPVLFIWKYQVHLAPHQSKFLHTILQKR